jgi:N-acetylmuramoyl-L-alanine amidase
MLNKKILLIALTGCTFLFTSFRTGNDATVRPLQKQAIKTIIVDAGHGGEDGGAKGVTHTRKILPYR